MTDNQTTSPALGQTLHFITSLKLAEVERQYSSFNKYADKVLADADSTTDPIERVSVLLKGIKGWPGLAQAISATDNDDNYEGWLQQARHDPSLDFNQVRIWEANFRRQLACAGARLDYARLFGNLLTDWIRSGDSQTTGPEAPELSGTKDAKAARAEMLEQKARIQELIFERQPMDTAAIEAYLTELFASEDAAEALASVRSTVSSFGETLKNQRVTPDDLDWLIKSLIARDLLSPEKTTVARSFLGNDVVLKEIASVLNMQLGSLDTWEWPQEGVYVEMRRHLSGKYRAYVDNELITALLLQYLGMQWSRTFKSAFRSVVNSRAWKRQSARGLTRRQLQRRVDFLKEDRPSPTIEEIREKQQFEQFFLAQLPENLEAESPYDEEPKAGEKPNSGNHAQQVLLRIVSTEAHLQRILYGGFTLVRADLEWFGPSLPHDSMLTVLKFFGLPSNWLDFFSKWLQPSLRFEKNQSPRRRQRGAPIAHTLSVLCGEAVLFGMDFAVNQKTGLYLYRIYDDFWFWHHESTKCADAWAEMKKYAELVGITFNMKKTGAVHVGGPCEPSLPRGDVGWGLLVFDAQKGRFVVNQQEVDSHIKEMRRQLDATKSVFGFVNAYNKYHEFLGRQFGVPANCFGQAHVDEVVDTLKRVQKELFATTDGSVVKCVHGMIEKRFGVRDIPPGWFFYRISRGGLQIHNSIVDYLLLQDSLPHSLEDVFTEEIENDRREYATLKERWRASPSSESSLSITASRDPDVFMPFDEYILGREAHLTNWARAYERLQEQPVETRVSLPPKVQAEVDVTLTPYEYWIGALYADEVFEKFGTLQIVEPTLIPVGMVSAYQTARISWES